MPQFTFLEFFSGAGMARIGLGSKWRCCLANDIDQSKASAYRANFNNASELVVADVASLSPSIVATQADLAWASFPCQDLSVAGNGAGLKGGRSGTFWPFWKLITGLVDNGRAPRLIALENVLGTLTSHGGRDFTAIVSALAERGYRVGALAVDAIHFVPQSRPRLFIIGQLDSLPLSPLAAASAPVNVWHSSAVVRAFEQLPESVRERWIWWRVPIPTRMVPRLSDIIERDPAGVEWNSAAETAYILSLMSPGNRAKVHAARKSGRPVVGAVYRRTRLASDGTKQQRAEIRFDGVAGCLRTPTGGSSRQTLLFVNGESIRSRLISPREVARLMGLPERYKLPSNYNETYHLVGDGVAVPVVRHLTRSLFERLLEPFTKPAREVAA
ncbi:MAG TPA: DNA cytosine methyltransferase [Gemmatimonadales bacterium]|nr:DNA cytosine methyltransferase [Gemmatimonadales bacterium]